MPIRGFLIVAVAWLLPVGPGQQALLRHARLRLPQREALLPLRLARVSSRFFRGGSASRLRLQPGGIGNSFRSTPGLHAVEGWFRAPARARARRSAFRIGRRRPIRSIGPAQGSRSPIADPKATATSTPRTVGSYRHETQEAKETAAAPGGPRGDFASAVARCLRTASTTSCSMMNAMTFILEPQASRDSGAACQVAGRRLCRGRRRGRRRGRCRAPEPAPPLARTHQADLRGRSLGLPKLPGRDAVHCLHHRSHGGRQDPETPGAQRGRA